MGDNVYIILELVTILLFWPNLPCIKIMKIRKRVYKTIYSSRETEGSTILSSNKTSEN